MISVIIIGLLIVGIVLLRLFQPRIKGKIGEKTVNKILVKKSVRESYIKNNFTMHYNTETVQIDHIYVTPSCILCIETKNYDGVIYGSENNPNWKVYYNGIKYDMYNPIMQNKKHINALYTIIPETIEIKNIVVFTGKPEIKVNSDKIFNEQQLKQYVAELNQKTNAFNYNEILSLIENKDEHIPLKEHIQNIRNRNLNI